MFVLQLTGHEPHELVRNHPRAAVRVLHRAVLRTGARPAGARTAESQRDGRTASDAQRLPHLPGIKSNSGYQDKI